MWKGDLSEDAEGRVMVRCVDRREMLRQWALTDDVHSA
jgi:hypothetical protein